MIKCITCGEVIVDGESAIQVREGYFENEDFIAEGDVCYQHYACYNKELEDAWMR